MDERIVYTIAEESVFLCVKNVPRLNLREELTNLVQKYGKIVDLNVLRINEDTHNEDYLIKASNIRHSRNIKRKIHRYSFFGFELIVRYMPELETIDDTRKKLQYFQIKGNEQPALSCPAAPIKRRKI